MCLPSFFSAAIFKELPTAATKTIHVCGQTQLKRHLARSKFGCMGSQSSFLWFPCTLCGISNN